VSDDVNTFARRPSDKCSRLSSVAVLSGIIKKHCSINDEISLSIYFISYKFCLLAVLETIQDLPPKVNHHKSQISEL
jgi:hypothetical protein